MANVMDYIKKYGDISFCDMPFGEADNVALCGMYYMPFDKVVSDSFEDEPVDYKTASDEIFELRGRKHTPVGLVLLKNISEQMVLMSKYKRFQEMKVVAAVRVYEKAPAVQFEAATFILPDGKIVVIFKGTDDTLTGWKEDFDILTKKGIPSNRLSIEYLEKAAKNFDGNIIVCGHSKGGFIAQYAALYSSKEVRDRIEVVYNDDGPGFWDYSYLESETYAEMLPKYRHFVPQSSFIGMMLAHDNDYEIIKSNQILGPLQHDLNSWQFSGKKLVRAEELTDMGKMNDGVLRDLVGGLDDESEKVLDTVLDKVLSGVNQTGLLDVKKNFVPALKGGVEAWRSLDRDTQKKFLKIFSDTPEIVFRNSNRIRKERTEKTYEKAVSAFKYLNVLF
ncbi:Mbeg1-like protein [uncultured Eubacterium sp.]|uniref:Mbeg1-like protein n=1 Tax=uncultured Eubacterium sp. TaxID=165185 RepID=UPI0015B287E7|nr:Mbeg1-like protein [uncultured Eubacterium sp.]